MDNQIRIIRFSIQNNGNKNPVKAKICSFIGLMNAVAIDPNSNKAGIKTASSEMEKNSFLTRLVSN